MADSTVRCATGELLNVDRSPDAVQHDLRVLLRVQVLNALQHAPTGIAQGLAEELAGTTTGNALSDGDCDVTATVSY
jgi:hypothetical protein